MDGKRRNIGYFKDFLKEQRQKLIKESQVKLEVDWWDKAIAEVLDDLKTETNGNLTIESVEKYCRTKNSILGREDSNALYDDTIILLHIKELIFQHHGDSFLVNCQGSENETIHTKGMVIEELANVILDKLRAISGKVPNEDWPTAKLIDKDSTPVNQDVPSFDECGDDENVIPEGKKLIVKSFDNYQKLLTEAASTLKCKSYTDVLDKCLKSIKKEAGSLIYEDVLKVVEKGTTMASYVHQKALGAIEAASKSGLLFAEDLPKDADTSKNFFSQALSIFANEIVADVLKIINKESGAERI